MSLDIASVNATVDGLLTVYPRGDRAFVSGPDDVPGQTVANAVATAVSANGTVCFYSQTPIDLLADVNGWFTA